LHPDIKDQDLHYLSFMPLALFACLEACSKRGGSIPSFFNVILDNKDIDSFQRKRFIREIRRVFHEKKLTLKDVHWKREQDEPLLLLPDLIGGIICREDRFHDAGPAASMIWDAEKAGRFKFVNKPPSGNA
jgi:hypothetical protein